MELDEYGVKQGKKMENYLADLWFSAAPGAARRAPDKEVLQLDGPQGVQSCNQTMRFSTFLKQHQPSFYKSFVREKELAKKNYQPKFAD